MARAPGRKLKSIDKKLSDMQSDSPSAGPSPGPSAGEDGPAKKGRRQTGQRPERQEADDAHTEPRWQPSPFDQSAICATPPDGEAGRTKTSVRESRRRRLQSSGPGRAWSLPSGPALESAVPSEVSFRCMRLTAERDTDEGCAESSARKSGADVGAGRACRKFFAPPPAHLRAWRSGTNKKPSGSDVLCPPRHRATEAKQSLQSCRPGHRLACLAEAAGLRYCSPETDGPGRGEESRLPALRSAGRTQSGGRRLLCRACRASACPSKRPAPAAKRPGKQACRASARPKRAGQAKRLASWLACRGV